MAFPDRDNPTHVYERRRQWDMQPGFAPNTPEGGQGTLFRGGPRWVERPDYMELDQSWEYDRAMERDPGAWERGSDPSPRASLDVRREAGRQHADRVRAIRAASAEGVRIYADSDTVPKMVEDGLYKSQHLTGTSNGSTDIGLREESEEHYGYDKPVYGSVGHSDNAMDHYGETALHLKPSESWRVDVSDGDTLDRYVDTMHHGGRWTHLHDPYGEHSLSHLRQVRSNPHPPGMSVDLTHESPYIEAVIDTGGSGVLPMTAFDRATVPGANLSMPGSTAARDRDAAADALEGAGIDVYRTSASHQPPLPMFSGMPTSPDTGLINWGKAPGGRTQWDVAPGIKHYGTDVVESNTDYKRRKAREALDT